MKSLLQLTWWKIVNICQFFWLGNECVFCTCKQHSDLIPDLQGVLFPSYLFLDIQVGHLPLYVTLSVSPSVAHHILGTVRVCKNDDISRRFFQFFKILIFWAARGVKVQKIAQNDKKYCTSRSVSQEPYIICLSFMVHVYKMIISLGIFFSF